MLVQNQPTLDALSNECMLGLGNQYRTRDCSALAVFLADLQSDKRIHRIKQLDKEDGGRHPNYMAILPVSTSFLLGQGHLATAVKQGATNLLSTLQPMPSIDSIQSWAYKNTALVVQSFVLAATSHDLATCVMEGFDARRLKRKLLIPDRYDIPMVVAAGYPYETTQNADGIQQLTARLELDEVVFEDSFGVPWNPDGDEENEADGAAGVQ